MEHRPREEAIAVFSRVGRPNDGSMVTALRTRRVQRPPERRRSHDASGTRSIADVEMDLTERLRRMKLERDRYGDGLPTELQTMDRIGGYRAERGHDSAPAARRGSACRHEKPSADCRHSHPVPPNGSEATKALSCPGLLLDHDDRSSSRPSREARAPKAASFGLGAARATDVEE